MNGKPFDYLLFGLRVRSELELPELVPAVGEAEGDVHVRVRAFEEAPTEAGLHVVDDGLVFVAPDAARYKVVGGREIIVAPNAGAPERNVRLYLLGSAFGALLHQRGMLPLHANAIEIGGMAVAFLGESGAGKSTLAAWFHDHGYRVIADDVCVVRFNAVGAAEVLQGLPRLRLWAEALRATGRNADDYERSYLDASNQDKFDVPVLAEAGPLTPLKLAGLYQLERAEEVVVEPISGVAAADTIFAHTYRGSFAAPANGSVGHWSAATRLAREVPIFSARRPWDLGKLDETGERLLDQVRNVIAGAGPGK